MTPEQKQQAKQLIADWTNVSKTSTPAVWFLNGDCMAGFLQELVDVDDEFKANVIAAINAAAHNARHCEVDGQTVFFSRSGDDITDTHTLTPCPYCGGSGAAEDYAQPAPSVPDVDWLSNVIRSVDGRHQLGAGALAEKIREAMLAAAPTPAEAPADAERLNWLDVQCSENNGRHIFCLPGGLRAAIDAAMSEKGGA